MKSTKSNKYPVKSVVKTLAILEHLGNSVNGDSLTEISTKLRIGKSTVHRLLATLRDHDFVWLDRDSSRYILGARILQLSEQLSRQSILIRYGGPILTELARATDETCNLGVQDGKDVLYLIIKESRNPLRMTGHVGKRLPLHCTALGKALLMGLSRDEVAQLYGKVQKLEKLTAKSPGTVSELLDRVNKACKTGIAFESEEVYPDVICLGAPVYNHSGKVIGAVSISLPTSRAQASRLEVLKTQLLGAASQLSRELGYSDAVFEKASS